MDLLNNWWVMGALCFLLVLIIFGVCGVGFYLMTRKSTDRYVDDRPRRGR